MPFSIFVPSNPDGSRGERSKRTWKIDINRMIEGGDCDNCQKENILVFTNTEYMSGEYCIDCLVEKGIISEV